MSGSVVTNTERNIVLNRTWNSVPTFSQITKSQFGTGAVDPTIGDTGLTSGVGNKYSLESIGVDLTNLQTTITARLTSVDGGTSTLKEGATFNTDATPSIGTKFVWSGTTLDGVTEIKATIKNRIRDTL